MHLNRGYMYDFVRRIYELADSVGQQRNKRQDNIKDIKENGKKH